MAPSRIWRQARCQLGGVGCEVVEILDFYHVTEHLGTVAAAVCGAGTAEAVAWLDQQRHTLRRRGGSRPVRHALAKLRPGTAAAAEEVRKARGYFRTHAARMRYPLFRARQFPIGSGAIESTAKNLIQLRQTQAGMRWGLPGAQAVGQFAGPAPLWTLGHLLAEPAPVPSAPASFSRPAAGHPGAPARASRAARVAHGGSAPGAASGPAGPRATRPAPRSRKPWEKGKDYWRRQSLSRRRSA